MKLRLTLDLNELDRDKLKKLIGKKKNVQFDDYRRVLSELIKKSLNNPLRKEIVKEKVY